MITITDTELRQLIAEALHKIAPETAAGALDARKPLRDQVDLDSMDWLNFLVALNAKLGIDIPEADYAKLVTLDDIVAYVKGRMRRA